MGREEQTAGKKRKGEFYDPFRSLCKILLNPSLKFIIESFRYHNKRGKGTEEELRSERESQTRLSDSRLWEAGGSCGDNNKNHKKKEKERHTNHSSSTTYLTITRFWL